MPFMKQASTPQAAWRAGSRPWQIGLQSARANMIPGMVLQLAAL
jgi:hypothetical protein